MKPTVNQLLEEIQKHLDKAEESTKKVLAPLAKNKLEQDQACACIELFEYNNYHINYNKYFVRAKDGKKLVEPEFFSAFGEDVGSAFPELGEYLANVFNTHQYTDQESEEFAPIERQKLFDHFKKCWFEVGGKECQVPTYFSFEKSYTFTDFETGAVADETQTIQKLGFPDAM